MPMCKGKQRYPTKRRAEQMLNAIWKGALRNGKDHELPCRTYKCFNCGKWHLTSKGERK